jgi:alcohol dehydrogenase class IV
MTVESRTGNWNYPTDISVGIGRIAELPADCEALGLRSPLLVTDPGIAALPMLHEVLAACANAGLECTVFSALRGNPTAGDVNSALDVYRSGGHDGVIAFGGGSAIDVAKAVALMAGQTRPLWDFTDLGDNWTRAEEAGIATVVAVPTTAGTGSEVGRAAVILNEDLHEKRLIFHPKMLPAKVILDPVLTVELPPQLTAATGMDALSHNLEAFCSPGFHPMADGIALQGMRLIRDSLPTAVAHGDDLEARLSMLVASSLGATAFQKGLGAMHALSHPLGALYDAHHGLLNAILMPYVLATNRESIAGRLEVAAAYLGLEEPSFEAFFDWIVRLRRDIGIPATLRDIGIDDRRQREIGEMAAADPSAAGNPLPMGPGGYQALFARAVAGEL